MDLEEDRSVSAMYGNESTLTSTELAECHELIDGLLKFERALPRGLYLKLTTWRGDLLVQAEDRAKAVRSPHGRG